MRGSRDLPTGGPLCPDGFVFAANTTYRQWVLNIDTLETGADQLVLADQNEEAAKLLTLNTRQQLSQTALSLASQADQNVLKLFR